MKSVLLLKHFLHLGLNLSLPLQHDKKSLLKILVKQIADYLIFINIYTSAPE
jgi:hypothetical protein